MSCHVDASQRRKQRTHGIQATVRSRGHSPAERSAQARRIASRAKNTAVVCSSASLREAGPKAAYQPAPRRNQRPIAGSHSPQAQGIAGFAPDIGDTEHGRRDPAHHDRIHQKSCQAERELHGRVQGRSAGGRLEQPCCHAMRAVARTRDRRGCKWRLWRFGRFSVRLGQPTRCHTTAGALAGARECAAGRGRGRRSPLRPSTR